MYYPKEDFLALHRLFLGIHTSSIYVIHRWKMYGTINGIHQRMIFVPYMEDVCTTSMEYFYREYLPSMEDQNMKKKNVSFSRNFLIIVAMLFLAIILKIC